MGLGLLLVPALGGYWFLMHTHATRYRTLRNSGYSLVFTSAIAGVALLAVARLLALTLSGFDIELESAWKSYAPFDYSGTMALTAVLAVAVPPLVNLFHNKEAAAKAAARSTGDLVEWVVQESLDT